MPGGQAAALTPSRLVIARKRCGLTLTQLAGLTGLSTRSISLYENGHTEPSADTLGQRAAATTRSAASRSANWPRHWTCPPASSARQTWTRFPRMR